MFFLYLSHFTFQKLTILSTLIIIAESVKIEKMLIPEVVQSGKAAILDCIYSGVSDQISVQWIFSDRDPPVYEWTPRSEPRVSGVLNGRLDLSYRPSALLTERRGALRIVNLDPELSGNYTCRIVDVDQATEARQTKYMLVFSPEKDLEVEFYRKDQDIEIKCRAQGLSPQPEMILEYNGVTFPKQEFRVWRSEEGLYDAENTALLSVAASGMSRPDRPQRITCRLQIPAAGYTAIKNEFLIGHECCNSRSSKASIFTLRLNLLTSLAILMLI